MANDFDTSPGAVANAYPAVMGGDKFFPAYESAQRWNRAATGGPIGLLQALFGTVDPAREAAAYNQTMLGGAQAAEANRLNLPKLQALSGVFNGTVDPATGMPYAQQPGQGGAPAPDQGGAAPAAGPAGLVGAMGGGQSAPTPAMYPPAPGGAQPGLIPSMAGGGAPPAPAPVNRLFGVPTPGNIPTRSAFMASQMSPELFKEYAAGMFAPARPNSYHIGPDGQQVYMPGGIDGVPFAPTDPRFNQGLATVKNIEAGATGAQDRMTARVRADEERKTNDHNTTNETGLAPATAGPGAASPQSDIPPAAVTPQGTLIPSVAEQPPLPRDKIGYQAAAPDWQKQDAALASSVRPAQEARQRLNTMARMWQLTQSGANATNAAEIGALAKSIGLSLPENWTGNVAAVQTALHENSVKTLNTLKAANPRFAQMEFKALQGNTEHPDLQPEANYNQLVEDMGALDQQAALARDSQTAKMGGWRNSLAFETAWAQKNPIEKFIAQAKQTTPPLKGMAGAAAAPQVGATATGPGGSKLRFDGKKWMPM